MARVELAPEVFEDFDRIFDHVAQFDVDSGPARIGEMVQALQILVTSPLIGWPVRASRRALVIGRGSRGCVALYRFVEDVDMVFVLGIRGQREAGFERQR